MKKNILYSLIFLQIFLVTLPSCRINAQSTRSTSYNASLKHELSPFKAIHVGDGFEVEILHSDKYSCEIFAQTMDNVNAIEPMIKKESCLSKIIFSPFSVEKVPSRLKFTPLIWKPYLFREEPTVPRISASLPISFIWIFREELH